VIVTLSMGPLESGRDYYVASMDTLGLASNHVLEVDLGQLRLHQVCIYLPATVPDKQRDVVIG
jgi:hypothetical protein